MVIELNRPIPDGFKSISVLWRDAKPSKTFAVVEIVIGKRLRERLLVY
jgi:hypothetical protein